MTSLFITMDVSTFQARRGHFTNLGLKGRRDLREMLDHIFCEKKENQQSVIFSQRRICHTIITNFNRISPVFLHKFLQESIDIEVIGKSEVLITKSYLYSFDPLKPHFYTVKLGFTG